MPLTVCKTAVESVSSSVCLRRRRDLRVGLQAATQAATGVTHPDISLKALLAVLLVRTEQRELALPVPDRPDECTHSRPTAGGTQPEPSGSS